MSKSNNRNPGVANTDEGGVSTTTPAAPWRVYKLIERRKRKFRFHIRQPHCQKQLMMLFHESESMTYLKHSVASTIEECINNECSFEIRRFELGVTLQVMGE